MQLPKLELEGKIYEMKKPRAKDWSGFIKFDEERKNLNLSEYIEKLCGFMATIFEGGNG